MPHGEYGLNFSPTNANLNDEGSDPGVAPIQSAIQTLSYRMPRISGGSPIAPPSLMQGPGSGAPGGMAPMGGPGGNLTAGGGIDIEALLRLILSGQFGQMGQMGSAPASMPAPNIVPGGGDVPLTPPPGAGMPKSPETMPPAPFPVQQPEPPPQAPPLNTTPGGPVGRPPRGRFA